jgi:hypothetical protein
MAELRELALWQDSKYSGRWNGGFMEASCGSSCPAGLRDHRQLPGIGTQRQLFEGELVGFSECSVPIAAGGRNRKRPLTPSV